MKNNSQCFFLIRLQCKNLQLPSCGKQKYTCWKSTAWFNNRQVWLTPDQQVTCPRWCDAGKAWRGWEYTGRRWCSITRGELDHHPTPKISCSPATRSVMNTGCWFSKTGEVDPGPTGHRLGRRVHSRGMLTKGKTGSEDTGQHGTGQHHKGGTGSTRVSHGQVVNQFIEGMLGL